jgi:hypothetical protein
MQHSTHFKSVCASFSGEEIFLKQFLEEQIVIKLEKLIILKIEGE